ncbi:MAG: hypothetical protein IJF07_03060, partial [Lachnospiraceae bacterium]|nr:hypothetical protein [Lachnospiraceae bacterium]
MSTYEELRFNYFLEDSSSAGEKSRKMMNCLIKHLATADYDEIRKLYDAVKPVRYSVQGYMESLGTLTEAQLKLFYAGNTNAILDIMLAYVDKLHAEKEIEKINTKYKLSILYTLAKRGSLLHKQLAATLGVTPSGLTAVIKQMNATSVKLINIEEVSKYTIYSLTPVAYQYVLKNNIKNFANEKREIMDTEYTEKLYMMYIRLLNEKRIKQIRYCYCDFPLEKTENARMGDMV